MNAAPIETPFTAMMRCDYPIIAAPMFLVSNEAIVIAASNAGGIGAAPSLNWRSPALFDAALSAIRAGTQKNFAINLIVNKTNPRVDDDLAVIVNHKVPIIITSLGNPQNVIEAVHAYGGKVFCDVTNLAHARKVAAQGADGVIAVSSGAGGHAGPVSPLVLIPYLRDNLDIPIIAAGGIAIGRQMRAALTLGADGVQVGTRFIASDEAPVSEEYKRAILTAEPEDIVLTSRISGTPASVINTPYIQKMGTDLSPFEQFLRANKWTARAAKAFRYLRGGRALNQSNQGTTWKTVWSAGQGVGFIKDIRPTGDIMRTLAHEYWTDRPAHH